MFFRKKTSESVNTDSVAKKWIKNMDAVVTWVILSGIVASIYGVKKLQAKKHEEEHNHEHLIVPPKEIERKSIWKRIFSR